MSLRGRVAEIAKAKKIPLCQVEKTAHIAKGSLSKWDTVSPSFEKVCAVASALGVSVENLAPANNPYQEGSKTAKPTTQEGTVDAAD